MLIKIRDEWSSEEASIVTPLNIYTPSRGGGPLRVVFAKAGGNEDIRINLEMELAERAINDAAKAGQGVVDLTPEACEEIRKKYGAPQP